MTTMHPPSDIETPVYRPAGSTWPKVIGIIAIVLGVIGIFQYGICTPISTLGSSWLAGMFEDMSQAQPGMEVQAAQLEALQEYLVPTLVSSLVAAALSITLLVGGIGLVRNRPSSARTLNVWAVLKILYTIPAAVLSYYASIAQFEAMREASETSTAPGQMPGGFFAMLESLGVVGAVIGLLWGWALPVFILIWFARGRIRDEVATWQAPPATGP